MTGTRPPATANDSSQPSCNVSTEPYARACCGAVTQLPKAHTLYSQRLSSPFLDLHRLSPRPSGSVEDDSANSDRGAGLRNTCTCSVRVSARLRPLRILTIFVCYETVRSRMRPKPRCISSRYSPTTPQYGVFSCDTPRSTSPSSTGGFSIMWPGEFF